MINQHPSIQYANEIAEICKPLHKFNISYFGHARVDKNEMLSSISTNPEFYRHYIQNGYYNADIHMVPYNNIGNFIQGYLIKN